MNSLYLIFYVASALIWFLIGYQLILVAGGYLYHRRMQKQRQIPLPAMHLLPSLTILIPAHNEELVIERTIQCMLALEYPADKLDVLVINDASTDRTAEIVDRLCAVEPRVKVLHRSPVEGGCGKAAALNAAISHVQNDYIAIYDADNCPESNAILLLMAHFLNNPELSAVVGKFRTENKRRNLLTRFINIEGLCFQSAVAGGRAQLFGIAALTGTNYIIRRDVLEAVEGWDEEALAEDSELSVRLYQHGYSIGFVPYSVTWEQEPETLNVWMRQRTRWARGNNYAFLKLLRTFASSKSRPAAFEMLFMLSSPYFFLVAIIFSQFLLVIGLFGVELMALTTTMKSFWMYAIILYLAELSLVLSYDKEATPENFLISILMYFSYCQLWLVSVLRSLYLDFIRREKRVWDKTVRFETEFDAELETRRQAVVQ